MRCPVFSGNRANAVSDTLIICIALFVFAIGSVIAYQTLYNANADIQADTDFTDAETKQWSNDWTGYMPTTFDNIFLFMFAILILGGVIASFLIDTHPIWFFLNIILLIAVFVVLIFLANSYDDFMTDAEFSAFATAFPYITWVMSHLLPLGIAIGFLIIFALFVKLK